MKYLSTTLMLFFIFFESSIQSKEFSIEKMFHINPLEQSYENPEFLDFDYVWDGSEKHKRFTFEEYKTKGSLDDPNGIEIVFGVSGNKNNKLYYLQNLNDKLVDSNCETIFNSISEFLPKNIRYYLDKDSGTMIKLKGSFDVNTDWRIYISCFQAFYSKNGYMGVFNIQSGHSSDIEEVLERTLLQCDYRLSFSNGKFIGKPGRIKFYIDYDKDEILAHSKPTHKFKKLTFNNNFIKFIVEYRDGMAITYDIDRISGEVKMLITNNPNVSRDIFGDGDCKKIEDKRLF